MKILKQIFFNIIMFQLMVILSFADSAINMENYVQRYVYGCGKKMKVLANRYTNKIEYVWSSEDSLWKDPSAYGDCIGQLQENYSATTQMNEMEAELDRMRSETLQDDRY